MIWTYFLKFINISMCFTRIYISTNYYVFHTYMYIVHSNKCSAASPAAHVAPCKWQTLWRMLKSSNPGNKQKHEHTHTHTPPYIQLYMQEYSYSFSIAIVYMWMNRIVVVWLYIYTYISMCFTRIFLLLFIISCVYCVFTDFLEFFI